MQCGNYRYTIHFVNSFVAIPARKKPPPETPPIRPPRKGLSQSPTIYYYPRPPVADYTALATRAFISSLTLYHNPFGIRSSYQNM